MTGEDKRYKLLAAAIALIVHIGVGVLMYMSYLSYINPEEVEPQPAKTDITFGGEYVMLGDIPLPDRTGDAAPDVNTGDEAPSGDDVADEGVAGDGAALVSTKAESAMKTEKKQQGPTKEELAEQQRVKREREKQAQESKKISSSVKNAFGKTGKSSGQSGSPNGNSKQGALAGQPGHTLGGYTLAHWGRPSSGYNGEITIRVRVDAQGNVIEAKYLRGTGAAASMQSVRRSCEQASLQSRFSVPKNTIGEKVGTIVWRFE